jgi:hypothetical protein
MEKPQARGADYSVLLAFRPRDKRQRGERFSATGEEITLLACSRRNYKSDNPLSQRGDTLPESETDQQMR